MQKKLRKNGFTESTFISWFAIVASKAMGILYNIPFYSLIGDGEFLYSIAYQVYALFLDISTSGIPTAISIAVGHYNSLQKARTKEKAYRIGATVILTMSLVTFLIMQFGASGIARFYLGKMSEGASVNEVATAIRVISLCILIVPFLSVRRGYLQGHGYFEASSFSQIIEQVIRVFVALFGSFLIIRIVKLNVRYGVYIALLAASIGAVAGFVYIDKRIKDNKAAFEYTSENERVESNRAIARRIASYCITITLVSIASSVYNIIDTKLMLDGLNRVGYSDVVNQHISSLISSWVPKTTEIMGALSTAMTASIAPTVAACYARGDMKEVNAKINNAISILLLISVPLTIGMFVFADPYFRMFYGYDSYGPSLLRINVIFHLILCFTMVLSMILQSLGGGRIVLITSLVSIVINTAGDLPFIYLLNDLGLPAFLGTSLSSIFAETIKLVILLKCIKNAVNINYRISINVMKKEIIPIAAMTASIIIIGIIWPGSARRFVLVPQLLVYALTGVLVYGILTYRNNLIQDVLGNDFTTKITSRIPFLRKES